MRFALRCVPVNFYRLQKSEQQTFWRCGLVFCKEMLHYPDTTWGDVKNLESAACVFNTTGSSTKPCPTWLLGWNKNTYQNLLVHDQRVNWPKVMVFSFPFLLYQLIHVPVAGIRRVIAYCCCGISLFILQNISAVKTLLAAQIFGDCGWCWKYFRLRSPLLLT